MRVVVYTADNESENHVLRSFYDGCPLPDKHITDLDNYEPSDVAVVFGTYKRQVPISFRRGNVVHNQKRLGKTAVILETGYIFRGAGPDHYYAAGLNGLNGRANFNNKNSPPDRYSELLDKGLDVKPWREDGEHVLVCGQVPWDASVDHIDFMKWVSVTEDILRRATPRRLIYRPHPLADTSSFMEKSKNKHLADDLKNCWCVVTFNSNSAVEAAISGIPVVAMDEGSMALPIANNIGEISHPNMPDRTQWLSDIAYAQWTPAEMKEGKAWLQLFPST